MGPSPIAFALTLAAALPSFRDASLESRCEALANFVADAEAQEKAFKVGSCAEGNGIGGATYTLDFKLGEPAKAYRVTVEYRGEEAKAYVKPPREPLEAAVAKWAGAKPKQISIYGKPYDDFVKGVLAYKGYYPALKGDKPTTIKLELTPGADVRSGKVRFGDKVDWEIMKCFDCTDAKCLNDGITYSFQDRFFVLTRKARDNYGAGWIIQGPVPIATGATAWKFVCGVSRYSLENVTL